MKKSKPQFQKIKPSQTVVDERYQREFDEKRARAMADAFDPALFGVPVLSRRADGTLVRIDAQHRLGAAEMAGLGDVPVLCEVHEGLTVAEEAELFLKLNGGRSAVRAFDKFRARLVAKEPIAIEIVSTLKSLGLKVEKTQAKRSVCAVQALDAVYHRGNLRETLDTLTRWGDGEPAAYENQLIKAVSAFLSEYPQVSVLELAAKLESHAPARVTARLRRTKDQFDCSSRMAACLAIRDIYNERRKRNQLPPPGKFADPVAAE